MLSVLVRERSGYVAGSAHVHSMSDRVTLWVFKGWDSLPEQYDAVVRDAVCMVRGPRVKRVPQTSGTTAPAEDLTCSFAGDASQRSMILAKRILFSFRRTYSALCL